MKSMGRIPCSRQVKFKRGPWTPEEDLCLTNYIQAHGEGRWTSLSKKSGLLRSGKSCRLRWINYLCPDVKRGHISPDEEDLILRLHRLLGNRWSLIAGRLPGRTDNDIKNYWNSHLSKKLISQGIDPRTDRPLSESEDIWWIPQDSDVHENTTSQENTNPDINEKDSKHDQISRSSMAAPEIYCSQSAPNAEEVPSVEMRKSNYYENLKQISDGSCFPHSLPPTPMGTSYANGSSYNMYSSFLESLLNEDLEMPEASVGYNSVSQQSELASPGYDFLSALQSPTIHYHRSH